MPGVRGRQASVLKMCGKRDLSGFRRFLSGIGCDVVAKINERMLETEAGADNLHYIKDMVDRACKLFRENKLEEFLQERPPPHHPLPVLPHHGWLRLVRCLASPETLGLWLSPSSSTVGIAVAHDGHIRHRSPSHVSSFLLISSLISLVCASRRHGHVRIHVRIHV